MFAPKALQSSQFLSTLPARGATLDDFASSCVLLDFYPRSPRGERLPAGPQPNVEPYFYPRSPRGERPARCEVESYYYQFLSTLPARGATGAGHGLSPGHGLAFLSTLPARGATVSDAWPGHIGPDFYPRSPRGERPATVPTAPPYNDFYPRSPRGERLADRGAAAAAPLYFYPRSPRGERLLRPCGAL